MTDRESFIAGIVECPADTLRRLVFADWLDENGEPEYAEFIRVQCELSPYIDLSLEPAKSLHRRERELIADYGDMWFPVPNVFVRRHLFDEEDESACLIYRGFVAEWRGPLAWWAGGECVCFTNHPLDDCPTCGGTGYTPAHGPALVRTQPVERVTLTDRDPLHSPAVDRFPADWSWVRYDMGLLHSNDRTPQFIPPDLWDMLEGFDTSPSARVRASRYHTRQAAIDALSAALLKWANGQPAHPASGKA
jgi:uncharacterized protein (TIGR02996 family)